MMSEENGHGVSSLWSTCLLTSNIPLRLVCKKATDNSLIVVNKVNEPIVFKMICYVQVTIINIDVLACQSFITQACH